MQRCLFFLLIATLSIAVSCQRSPKQEVEMVRVSFKPQFLKEGAVSTQALPTGFFCYAIGVDLESEAITAFTPHCNLGGSIFPKLSAIIGPFENDEIAQFEMPTGNHEFYIFASTNSANCQPGATLTSPDFLSSTPQTLMVEEEVSISSGENNIQLTITLSSGLDLLQCANGVDNITNITDTPFNTPD